jgi:hypothetical protein
VAQDLVELALERVEQRDLVDALADRRTAGVAGERGREHVVTALQRGQHELPGVPRVGEAVQQQQRRALTAAMGGGEANRTYVHGRAT